MKLDPYKSKEQYLAWKERTKTGIPRIGKQNSDLTLQYIRDMEDGINIAQGSVKGSRSYSRLLSLRNRMVFFSKKFKEIYNLDNITEIKEEQLISFFSNIRRGIIKREDGQEFKSIETHAKVFKAFWHWWMKINKKKGIEIPEITADLDTKEEKPDWVYLNEEQVKKLCNNAKYKYKVLIMFLYDTGIRAPTELLNIKISDFFNDFRELNIREETSKTFGRRIKLMLCTNLIKEYVKLENLRPEDYLFKTTPIKLNQYLKRLAKKVLGEGVSEAGEKYSNLTMYDFRHCSCCYWLPRYKSESALKYRFGWKSTDKIHYYSELLGMKDTISEDDLLIDVTKTEIEQRLDKSEKEKTIMREELNDLRKEVDKIRAITNMAHGVMIVKNGN
jgi:integrase